MRFTKMHGAGNDYVYVDLFDETVADAPSLARAVSDRHKGIGGDGLILLAPSDQAAVRMIMYNADGSRAEMCGNGIRCLAKLARDHRRASGDEFAIETDSGVLTVRFTDLDVVDVDMGVPEVIGQERIRGFDATLVSMSNPHCVIYVDDVDAFDVGVHGPAIENDARFPDRTNVEFVQVVSEDQVRQRTWERGSGETLACGTGACAVGVAGVVTGVTSHELYVQLRGGILGVRWDGQGSVHMAGNAVEVFTGEWHGDGV